MTQAEVNYIIDRLYTENDLEVLSRDISNDPLQQVTYQRGMLKQQKQILEIIKSLHKGYGER